MEAASFGFPTSLVVIGKPFKIIYVMRRTESRHAKVHALEEETRVSELFLCAHSVQKHQINFRIFLVLAG